MRRLSILTVLFLAFPAFGQPGLKLPDVPKKEVEGGRGYKPLTPEKRRYFQELSHAKHGNRLAMMAQNQALPASFDARDKVPLAIWNQADCGSCWLVSTVRTATCCLILNGYGKADSSFMLAAQYGMDRPHNFGGNPCNGGNGTEVIDWMVKNGWIAETYIDAQGVVHKDYPPYDAREGKDRTKAGAKVWMKGADWGFVNANGKPTSAEIEAAIYNYGRLNISLDAGGQFSNGTGTITSLGGNIDHEINMVAFDRNKAVVEMIGDPMGKFGIPKQVATGAFLLENQWSDSWGTKGCRWVTYAAAKQIVDIFYVTAAPLPTPPTPPDPLPPDPPGPGPAPGTDTITITLGGKTQSFELFPIGSKAAAIKAREDQIKRLQDEIDAIKRLNAPEAPKMDDPPKPLPKGEPTMSYSDWLKTKGWYADARIPEVRAALLAREYETLYGSKP